MGYLPNLLVKKIKRSKVLSEKLYQKASFEFGTAVGVAHITGYKKKTEHITEYTPESYKQLSDELDINYIITDSIEMGIYQELQREIYDIRLNNKRIKKELSIYKKAWNNINGKQSNKTKSSKILQEG
jgi:hypothetical protein